MIKTAWEEYRKIVVHPKAGKDQVRELELAFYGGAAIILSIVLELSTGTEKEGVETLEELRKELNKFHLEVKKRGKT